MKKADIIARYSELAENRNDIASMSADMLTKIVANVSLTGIEEASVHADIATIAAWDLENDQREIANLIAVANSDAFEMNDRAKARDRVLTMLELDQ